MWHGGDYAASGSCLPKQEDREAQGGSNRDSGDSASSADDDHHHGNQSNESSRLRTDRNPAAAVSTENLPSDVEELNRAVQQRGYLQDAYFAFDEATLPNGAQAALTTSANWLKRNPQYNLLIEGHCDERGTEQYNLALGDRRANTAKEYLMTLGVDGNRMRTVSYGEERPFDSGHDETAWAKNRRAHLVLVGK